MRRRTIAFRILLFILVFSSIFGYFPNSYYKNFFINKSIFLIRNDLQQENITLSYPFPPDDRLKINTTSIYPWSTICKLFIIARDNTEFIGSGAMLDEFHILTCGHCVYIHEHGGWVNEVKVVPGMNGAYEPFGHAYATYYRSYTGWIQDKMAEHDWAVVTLDRNIGNFTGWMERKTADPSDSIYTGTLHTAGYPSDLDSGYSMYYDSDTGEDADQFNHYYWMDTASGQSGGPVWQEDGGSLYILSINAYEFEEGEYANVGTRLNQDKFDQITAWLAEDSPPSDRPDLLNQETVANISTTVIPSDETLFSIFCDVKNGGTASATSFKVNFYATYDNTLSSSDYLIGTTTISSLDPLDYTAADWSGIFPSDIPNGYYYIGWIIDVDDEIMEIDEENNVVLDFSLQIHVGTLIPPFLSIFIPIVITVGAILIVLALAYALRKRSLSMIPVLEPPQEDFSIYGPNSDYIQEQKAFIRFCTNCNQPILRNTQRYCPNCGSRFNNNNQ